MAKNSSIKAAANAMAKMSNAEILTKVAELAPQFKEVAAKNSQDVFTEKGFEAFKNLPTGSDNLTTFYGLAMMIGLQKVELVKFHNPIDDIGLLARFGMSLGEYFQMTHLDEIPEVDPGWLDVEDGESIDQQIVRKTGATQDYWMKNLDFQNQITIDRKDLKKAWIRENGIGEFIAGKYRMVDLSRVKREFGLFFTLLDGAITSTDHPLQASQKLKVDSWTDGAVTDEEINNLIKLVKDLVRAIDADVASTEFNAAAYPNYSRPGELVMLVRVDFLSMVEKVLGYAFNPEKLNLPIAIKGVLSFGGLVPQTAEGVNLQPVANKRGVIVGYVYETDTVNGRAVIRKSDGKYVVNVTREGTTADVELVVTGNKAPKSFDPHADVIAVIAEKGIFFELIQNGLEVIASPYNGRGDYQNVWFNERDNGMGYNHYKTLITISKPSE